MSERLDQASSASTGLSVPWFFRSGWRLFGTLALTLAVLIGALTALVVAQTRRSLQDQAVRQNTLVTRLVAWAVEAQFEGLTRYADSFTLRPLLVRAVERRDSEGVRLHLRELVTRNPRFDRAFVADAQGTLWSDYPHAPEVAGQNFSHRDWYRGVSTTKNVYVSEIYQRAAPPKPYLVAIAVPIRNARQETIGYLVAQHTLEALTTWLAEVKPSPAGSVALVDHRGGLATTQSTGTDGPHSLSQHPLVQRALAGESGSAVASDPLTGEKSLISYTAVPAIGWAVLSRQPVRVVFGPATALQRTIGILSLTFFAIMLGLGFVWLNTIRRHQHALLESNNAKDRYMAELDRTIADRTRAQEAASKMATSSHGGKGATVRRTILGGTILLIILGISIGSLMAPLPMATAQPQPEVQFYGNGVGRVRLEPDYAIVVLAVQAISKTAQGAIAENAKA